MAQVKVVPRKMKDVARELTITESKGLPSLIEDYLGIKPDLNGGVVTDIPYGHGSAINVQLYGGKGFVVYDSNIPGDDRNERNIADERGALALRLGVIPTATQQKLLKFQTTQMFAYRRNE